MGSEMRYGRALDLIRREYDRAIMEFKPFHTAHEGWAVLKEEADELQEAVDDLWEAVKANPLGPYRTNRAIEQEAIQVGAMALRLLVDCCEEE